MSDSVNDYLLSGGVSACKFPAIGTVGKGTVVASDVVQQKDLATGEAKFYKDGNPMMQVVITLQTDERDPDTADDDGLRKLYVKGQMTTAIREALRAAKAKLEVGGTLAVQFVEEKAPETRGFNPTKIYQAQYRPPVADVTAGNDLLGGPDAAAPARPSADSLI